jgi:hypothetical protein
LGNLHAHKISKKPGALVTTLYFRLRPPAAAPQSSPLLEQLLARADAPVQVTDWRADAIRSQASTAETFAAGPLALSAASGPVDGAWVCIATPVHYTAEMSNVRLARDGILRLGADSAAALAQDFNRVWRDSGICMKVGRFADLFCIFDQPLVVATQDPERVLDRHIESFLPQGADAPRLRQLMSEMEMWLFEHPAMGTRARPAKPVNGLWLWGGGVTRRAALPGGLRCSGDDAVFSYFGGDVSRGGIVSADAGAPELAPAVGRLKSGQLGRMLLSAGDFCYEVSRANLRRFWRRGRRPWNEYFT